MRIRSFRNTLATLALLLGGGGILMMIPRSQGQEPDKPPTTRSRPIPAVDFHIPFMGLKIFAMHSEGNKPVLGRPTAQPQDLRYFYLPLWCFQRSGTGEVEVHVTDEGEITLPMIYDSEAARHAVKDFLVMEKLVPADSMAGQVMTVAAKVWHLETAPGYFPSVKFGPFENFQFPLRGQLHTRLAPELARKFVSDLKAGRVELNATIVFEGYSFKENTVVIQADDILNSEQYKKLSGPGGKGFIGRHQVARILREACLVRGIQIGREYDDPDFEELVKSIVLNYTQKESKPIADFEKLEAFFKETGFDVNDFKADLIEAAKTHQSKDFRDTFAEEIQKASEGGGSLNVLKVVSLGGSGRSNEMRKVFREVADKWSISTEFKGQQFIPKSIDVYMLNTGSIRQASVFAVGKRRKTVSDGILTVAVNPKTSALHTKASPLYEERLAALSKRVDKLAIETKTQSITTQELTITNTSGVKVASLTHTDGGPELTLYRDGKARIKAYVDRDGYARFLMNDQQGGERVAFTVRSDAVVFGLKTDGLPGGARPGSSARSVWMQFLWTKDDGPEVRFNDKVVFPRN